MACDLTIGRKEVCKDSNLKIEEVVNEDVTQIGELSWRIIVGFPIIPALIRLHTSQNVYRY